MILLLYHYYRVGGPPNVYFRHQPYHLQGLSKPLSKSYAHPCTKKPVALGDKDLCGSDPQHYTTLNSAP